MKSVTHTPPLARPAQKFSPHPRRPIPPFSSPGFSLTEVVIALGVAAVAFTSIIGLFPLGLNMSKESYEESQAALLAQTIVSDLRDQLTGNNYATARLLQVGSPNSPYNWDTDNNYYSIDTSLTRDNPQTLYVAYRQIAPSDLSNGQISLRPFAYSPTKPDWYLTGNPGAIALAKISLFATFRLSTTGNSNPQRVDISIETPGDLSADKRKQFVFAGAVAP